jgi:hypothetical protein
MANYAVLRATKTFFVNTSEGVVKVVKGDLVRAGHEITKGREELFGPIKVKFDYDVKAAEAEAAKLAAAAEEKAKQEAAKAAADVAAETAKVAAAAKAEAAKPPTKEA